MKSRSACGHYEGGGLSAPWADGRPDDGIVASA